MTIAKPDRVRLAEFTSGVGAFVLGIGLGALIGERVGGFGLLLLLVGATVHAWGMFDKHRQERQTDAPAVWWGPLAYWTCWGFLAVLALAVAARTSGVI